MNNWDVFIILDGSLLCFLGIVLIFEMMKQGKDIEEILSFTNPIILKEGYGFSENDIKIANNIWKRLLNRRMNRS